MSQFGTIRALLPSCTGHPSCSQFVARDIIGRFESETTQRCLRSSSSMELESKGAITNEISRPTVNIETVLQIDVTNTLDNERMVIDEVPRRYVEISPGVWSYMK